MEPLISFALDDAVPRSVTVLVPPRRPPEFGVRDDGRVETFLAVGDASDFVEQATHVELKDLCYELLSRSIGNVTTYHPVRVIHQARRSTVSAPETTLRLIVPHRGESHHLAASLRSISIPLRGVEADVCFDQPMVLDVGDVPANLHFHHVLPRPAGPYVIRQHFGMSAPSEFIGFQDSDDFSTPDRIPVLLDAAVAGGLDIVGCHELRLDELRREVLAIRFPLDVTAALGQGAAHPQFFPTTIVRTARFRSFGGFSTVRRHSSDTQYLLRAYFSARIGNVDEFLYIRRRRAGSLTTHPKTALGTPVRQRLDRRWKSDFAQVKAGGLDLEASSLRIEPTPRAFTFTDLRSGVQTLANFAGHGAAVSGVGP